MGLYSATLHFLSILRPLEMAIREQCIHAAVFTIFNFPLPYLSIRIRNKSSLYESNTILSVKLHISNQLEKKKTTGIGIFEIIKKRYGICIKASENTKKNRFPSVENNNLRKILSLKISSEFVYVRKLSICSA